MAARVQSELMLWGILRYPPNGPNNRSRRSGKNRDAPAKNQTPVFLLRQRSLYVHPPVDCDKTTLFPDNGDKLDLRNISLYSGLTRMAARCFFITFRSHERFASYTGCPRRNVPDSGRVFLMLKYTDITQNTYVQS